MSTAVSVGFSSGHSFLGVARLVRCAVLRVRNLRAPFCAATAYALAMADVEEKDPGDEEVEELSKIFLGQVRPCYPGPFARP